MVRTLWMNVGCQTQIGRGVASIVGYLHSKAHSLTGGTKYIPMNVATTQSPTQGKITIYRSRCEEFVSKRDTTFGYDAMEEGKWRDLRNTRQ